MNFQPFSADFTTFLARSLFDLFFTVLVYGAGPVLFCRIRKSPVTLRAYRSVCLFYTVLIWLLLSAFYLLSGVSGTPNMAAAVLWGVVFYRICKKRIPFKSLEKTNRYNDLQEPKQIVEVYRSKFRMPNDLPAKKQTRNQTWIMIAALCVALFVSIFANVYQIYKASKQSLEMENMKSDLSVYEAKTNQLQASYDDAAERAEQYEEEASFLNRRIGFIVGGSSYYHSYLCSVFQESGTFWAHNREYCESLGYGKCPICGFVFD